MKDLQFDVIYDLHDVIRTKALRILLANKTKKIRIFKKERGIKSKIINKKIKIKKLDHTTERYKKCLSLDFPKIEKQSVQKNIQTSKNKTKRIGIAPFAAHKSKIWPLEKYNDIIQKFEDYKFIIFAFGQNEIDLAKEKLLKFKNCSLVDQNLSINDQSILINDLKLFITMDSANMHLSSLTNTKVISIWGPTHPYLGFGPLFNEENIIQIDTKQLPCRPCSVYGKIKPKDENCARESMERISSSMVITKIKSCLKGE